MSDEENSGLVPSVNRYWYGSDLGLERTGIGMAVVLDLKEQFGQVIFSMMVLCSIFE